MVDIKSEPAPSKGAAAAAGAAGKAAPPVVKYNDPPQLAAIKIPHCSFDTDKVCRRFCCLLWSFVVAPACRPWVNFGFLDGWLWCQLAQLTPLCQINGLFFVMEFCFGNYLLI